MLIYDPVIRIDPDVFCLDFLSPEGSDGKAVTVYHCDPSMVLTQECDDGWWDIAIREMTPEAVKAALAKVNGVDPSEIELVPR